MFYYTFSIRCTVTIPAGSALEITYPAEATFGTLYCWRLSGTSDSTCVHDVVNRKVTMYAVYTSSTGTSTTVAPMLGYIDVGRTTKVMSTYLKVYNPADPTVIYAEATKTNTPTAISVTLTLTSSNYEAGASNVITVSIPRTVKLATTDKMILSIVTATDVFPSGGTCTNTSSYLTSINTCVPNRYLSTNSAHSMESEVTVSPTDTSTVLTYKVPITNPTAAAY
jgi:hypothetical protein